MNQMNNSKYFEKIEKEVTEEIIRFVDKSEDISEFIFELLKIKGITQKELAKQLGKNESEISKWLAGSHNFTLKSICKLEVALGAEIINVSPLGTLYNKGVSQLKVVHSISVNSNESAKIVTTKETEDSKKQIVLG